MSGGRLLLLPLLAALVGCGGGSKVETQSDATISDAGGSDGDGGPIGPVVEIGTGSDLFIPLTEDQAVEFTVGTQGGGRFMGVHIWGAVRTRGMSPAAVKLLFHLRDASGRIHATAERIDQLEKHGDDYVRYGVAPRIDDCCLLRNQRVLMTVSATDADGNHGADQRHLMTAECPPEIGPCN